MLQKIVLAVLTAFTVTAAARAEGADSVEVSGVSYIPEVFGAVKAKFETSLYDGSHRFNVRNSRIGVRGHASPRMKYAIQIDFSNEGKLSILDSYVTYYTDRFEATLGQQQYRFSTDLDRGPNTSIFSNRSFLAKFLTTYYTTTYNGSHTGHTVSSIGSRDLGALVRYRLPKVPARINFGLFNGSGTNNPEWDNKINIVTKLELGRPLGFHGALGHYNGHTPASTKVFHEADGTVSVVEHTQRMRLWGAELSYSAENFTIESEYAQRRLRMDGLRLMHTAHVQGYYQFHLPKSKVMEYIAPVGRWDIGENIEFADTDGLLDIFSANRATVGVNFGFTGKIVGSELRLQFEKYFVNRRPGDFSRNQLLQDKVTLEIVATF
ncbi:MAG: hypothetical protein LIO77_09850 [Rikenellaceae bacterium]|nr:hypothetical protein [Rikenellaceae bacterium]